jgi:hypothetical protein
MMSLSTEDEFLARLARGGLVSQDEWDQLSDLLPPVELARALALRFDCTGETRMLTQAARLYLLAGLVYQALEVCSRAPSLQSLQTIIEQSLPRVRRDYPDTKLVGKLLDEAFLVIDLSTGKMLRFPPLLPARG